MVRVKRVGGCLVLIALVVTTAGAQNLRVIPLQYADARVVASMFGGPGAGATASRDNAERFARESLVQGSQQLRQGDISWIPFVQARSYPHEGPDWGVVYPPGLTRPPVALPEQNALLVRGSEVAMDQLREVIALLDRPTPMVTVEVCLMDEPRERGSEWGVDFKAWNPSVEGESRGNVPARGVQLRWGIGQVGMGVGWDRWTTTGKGTTGASVTTFSGVPATVSFGEVLPFFAARVTRDPGGNRQVDYEPWAVFAGIELWVEPRLTADNTVTLRLRPAITEAAGVAMAPDGSAIPVTKTLLTETQVRVRDGESLVIGGFRNLRDSQTERVKGLLGGRRITRTSDPVLIVTPRQIREIPPTSPH